MFENQPQRELSASAPLKLLAGSAVGIVLAFGLCGAALALHSGDSMGMLAIAVFGFSVLGFVAAVVWLIVIAITNAFRK